MDDLRKDIPFELIKPAPAPNTPEAAKSPEAPKDPVVTKGGAE